METKICSYCKKKLNANEFAKKGNGLQARCRKCHSLYTREHYSKNKQYYIEKAARRNNQSKEVFAEFKASTPCSDCGKYYPPECMDFDHLENKKFNLARRAYSGFSQSVLEEIDKCELVCANCHRTRTKNRLK